MFKTFGAILLTSFCVYFFSWLVVYKIGVNSLVIQSEDTVPAIFLPLAIVKDHTLYLDKYYQMMVQRYPNPDDKSYQLGMTPFYLRKVNEHYVSAFPIITALFAIPFYFVAVLMRITFDWNTLAILVHISASFIMACSVGLFYILARQSLKLDEKKSKLLTFIYAFCTINYALVSQGLWQHGTVQLFSIAALIYFLKFFDQQKFIDLFYYGLFIGFALLSRPTSGLTLVILSIFIVLRKDPIRMKGVLEAIKRSAYIGFGLLVPFLFFVWYNAVYYVSIENQGYANQLFKNWLGDFPTSFIGVWLSPSKGILVYSPVLFFALLGTWLAIKNKIKDRQFFLLCALIVLLHTLVISFWKHWFGGWSFGYRMTSDVIPFIVLLIIPWLLQVSASRTPEYGLAASPATKVFYVTVIFSLLVQLSGMVYFDGIWHAAYDRGFKDPRWLWSLKDSELAFNARRTLVKLGYLDKACPTCAK